jgi:hypothetical protein
MIITLIIIIIIKSYLIFLWDCKITYSNKKYVWKIEYNGLLWVGLSYWSIWKYESDDIPIKWFNWN